MRGRRIVLGVITSLGLALAGGTVNAQQGPVRSVPAPAGESVFDYWTPEQMASAIPTPFPGVPTKGIALTAKPTASGDPGLVNGWMPGSGPFVEHRQTFPGGDKEALAAPQVFGVAPANPLSGPYGPFQRWTMQGSYTPYPRSIHGKLFFTLNGLNYVCSGTVIGRSTVATAGHCVSDGSATFASNFMFCPSYSQVGASPTRGCWGWSSVVTSNPWHNAGDPDYDYACIVTRNTGTIVADKIGNVTGWAGRAWNWNDVPEMTFGYPQAAPFAGNTIQQTASVDWYNVDFTPGGPASKVIGSDLTPGASGGGWFLSWRAPGAEVADTDGSNATDPAGANNGPFINGVNSHKRCAGGSCASPPNNVAGVFWQEMTSPRFRLDANDNNDSEDIFAICLAHANNNP